VGNPAHDFLLWRATRYFHADYQGSGDLFSTSSHLLGDFDLERPIEQELSPYSIAQKFGSSLAIMTVIAIVGMTTSSTQLTFHGILIDWWGKRGKGKG
jgi:hypothetical protein